MRRTLLSLALLLSVTTAGFAQTALVQVIHNCADPLAAAVDIYVNGEKALDDVAFRSATAFTDLPINASVAIAPASSSSVGDAIYTEQLDLMSGSSYLLIATGVVVPNNFAPNADPEAKSLGFDLLPIANARQAGSTETDVDVIVYHGSTDAPKVDVLAGNARLIEGLSYGEATDYLTVPPASYTLSIAPTGGNPLLAYTADLSTLGGQAITVIASGFLTPSANQNGPAFGLFAITKDGGAFLELPTTPVEQFAQVQIIHNAADPLVAVVDIYVNGEMAADDFAFRSATGFVSLPANTDVSVAIALSNSTSVADAVATVPFNLPVGRYVAIANGVVTPAAFAPNPDPRAQPIGFKVYPISNIRPGSLNPGEVDFIVFHGSTDAPAVDVYANGQLKLITDLVYGAATEYISVPAGNYTINVAPTGGEPIANFRADLAGLAGNSLVVVASGFLAPASNNNGPAFGLFAALADGGALVELPPVTSSVDEENGNVTFSVAPNPASVGNSVSISGAFTEAANVTISSLVGNVVASSSLGNLNGIAGGYAFDTSVLSSGVYMITVTDGGTTTSMPLTIIK